MAEETSTQQQSAGRTGATGAGRNGGGVGYVGEPSAATGRSGAPAAPAGTPPRSEGKIVGEPTLSGAINPLLAERAAQRKKLIIGGIIGTVVIVGGILGLSFLSFSRTHTGTDDAYVTGNLVNVSPIISGTLISLNVAEGDTVHKGELIGRLDDSGQMAALRQAQAAYASALSQVPEARTMLLLQQEQTDAAIQHAQAALQAQQARTHGAEAQRQLAEDTTRNQVDQSQAQVSAAMAQAKQADAQIATARASLQSAEQAVTSAEHGASALQAKVQAAQAEVARTQADLSRYAKLLHAEAVTQQQYDSIASQATTAQSNLDSLNDQVAQAQSQSSQATDNVAGARAQLAAVEQADVAAHHQVDIAQAGVGIARANLFQNPLQISNVNAATATDAQSSSDVQNALSGKTQIVLQRQRISTAEAQAAQAQAMLTNAQVQENYTYLYAPTDGTVVRKTSNVGASLSTGQTVVTITQGNYVWVTGNFKETQLTNMRVGQPAEIDVDAFPHKSFKGVVASINDATGATMSLLPPDNATGNFTKVVQRIPVRIAIVPGNGTSAATQDDIALLRQGMSVSVTVDTSDQTTHADRVPQNYDGVGSNGYGTVSGPVSTVSGDTTAPAP